MKEYKLMNNTVNVLGTNYKILYITEDEDAYLKECSGFCDRYKKEIIINKRSDDYINAPDTTKNYLGWINNVLIHELTHAFLTESGVSYNQMKEENICDFLEINLIKIYNAFQKCKFIEIENEETF